MMIVTHMKLHLLYIGDCWLTNSSLELLAVCSTFDKAIELACEHAKKHGNKLWESDVNELREHHQTYGRNDNYMISNIISDTLED